MGGPATPRPRSAACGGRARTLSHTFKKGHTFAGPQHKVAANVFLLFFLAVVLVLAASCTLSEDAGTTTGPEATGPAATGPEATGTTSTDGEPEEQLPDEKADEEAGTGIVTESDRLAPQEGPYSICPDCHAFFDPPGQIPATLMANFSHTAHLDRGANCDSCHQRPTHTRQGTRPPRMVDCFTCHDEGPEAAAPAECGLCHPQDFDLTPASHTPDFYEETHPEAAASEGTAYCALCHEGEGEQVCELCHGLTMPHPTGFALAAEGGPGEHVDRAHAEPELCERCHEIRPEPPAACYGSECHGT
ncbi:MAG: hypothetical protein Kow00122_03050 [Thermoleophilia bacterium]